jgi:hypothetical protein
MELKNIIDYPIKKSLFPVGANIALLVFKNLIKHKFLKSISLPLLKTNLC